MTSMRLGVLGFGICLLAMLPFVAKAQGPARPPKDDADQTRWLQNMIWYHHFTNDEVRAATGMTEEAIEAARGRLGARPERGKEERLLVLPYPGGRHPRIGFLDGAVDPQRDTKVSVFTPWDPASYVVIDVPEAMFTNLGLTYLAHTHVPTIWDKDGVSLEPVEWSESASGVLTMTRLLPNRIEIGSRVEPTPDGAKMELVLTNGTDSKLDTMRAQVCVMLKGAKGFDAQTNENKIIRGPFVAVRDETGRHWIVTAWTPLNRAWANPPVPCLHSDPALPDCAVGETVKAEGRIWLIESGDVEEVFRKVEGEWAR